MGESQNKSLEKKIFLQIIDFSWRSHLQYLEQLRTVIGLRSYGQRDPLVEYKKEAFSLFENFIQRWFNMKIMYFLKENPKRNHSLRVFSFINEVTNPH